MNVYDFDGTIYDGDSTVDFWKYCLVHRPLTLIAVFPAAFAGLLYAAGIIGKTRFKQVFYLFLRFIHDVDDVISDFWMTYEEKIWPWYLAQKQDDDLIISASPQFLLTPVCKKLGVRLIASTVDKNTGKYTGVNCDGEEKVRRLRELYPDSDVQQFYSDRAIDTPLAEIANKSFRVKNGVVTKWDF